MSEPDAVPLPREGQVFFDVRGDARTMRLSWYAESKIAVFSIWQGSRCTGTFRLPFADLDTMVHTLQSGPPQSVPFDVSDSVTQVRAGDNYGSDAYGGDFYGGDGYHDGYAAAGVTGAYDGRELPYPDGGDLEPAYLAGQPYEAPYEASEPYGTAGDHGHSYGQEYDVSPRYEAGPSYDAGASQAGGSRYEAGPPYEASPRYEYGAQYEQAAVQPYEVSQPYGADQQYSSPRPHGRHGSADAYEEPYGQHGPGYDRPHYPEPAAYAEADREYRPGRHGYDEDPRATEAESVPDAAMLSFPSVPARNGPAGYR